MLADMKLEEYQKRLIEANVLAWNEYKQKVAELQTKYLSEQVVSSAETAIKFICDAQNRGELPELDASDLDCGNCEMLELIDEDSPDERCWRCRFGDVIVDVSAESGEVSLMSA